MNFEINLAIYDGPVIPPTPRPEGYFKSVCVFLSCFDGLCMEEFWDRVVDDDEIGGEDVGMGDIYLAAKRIEAEIGDYYDSHGCYHEYEYTEWYLTFWHRWDRNEIKAQQDSIESIREQAKKNAEKEKIRKKKQAETNKQRDRKEYERLKKKFENG